MKGDKQLLEALNARLAEELTAINQYIVHAEMCENWGYAALHDRIMARAVTEMKHAEALIGRILFLEGKPVVSKLGTLHIGADVPAMIANDRAAELDAVAKYNATIQLACKVGDNATKEVLDHILVDEDGHLDEIEEMGDQVSQMGLPVFLSIQVRKA